MPAVELAVAGTLNFITLSGLIELKLGAGRAKDIADMIELIKLHRSHLQPILDHLATVHRSYATALPRTNPPSRRRMTKHNQSDLVGGRPLAECPISTIDGVKTVDVGWYSDTRFAEVKGQIAFERAPEI